MESATLYLQIGEKSGGRARAPARRRLSGRRNRYLARLACEHRGRQAADIGSPLFAIARALDLNKVADLLPDTDAADVATSIVRSVIPIGRDVTEKQRHDISKLINDVPQQPKPTGKKQTR